MVKDKVSKVYYALKIMSIAEVLRLKQTEHVKNEKEILTQVKHPFIINLYAKLMNYKKLIYKLIMALKKKKKDIGRVTTRSSSTCYSSMYVAASCSAIYAMPSNSRTRRPYFSRPKSWAHSTICTHSPSSIAISSPRICSSIATATWEYATSASPRKSTIGTFF